MQYLERRETSTLTYDPRATYRQSTSPFRHRAANLTRTFTGARDIHLSHPDNSTAVSYVPAMGRFDLLGRWHDVIADVAIRRELLHADLASQVQVEAVAMEDRRSADTQAAPRDPQGRVCVLDIGCGTGQLLRAVSDACRAAGVVPGCIGIDRDARQVLRATQNAAQARDSEVMTVDGRYGPRITPEPQLPQFVQACSTSLPLARSSVDIATSCISMHHFSRDERRDSLAEIVRVLRPDGTLVLTDCWKSETLAMRALSYLVAIADGFERTRENRLHGLRPAIADAGFRDIRLTKLYPTFCGTVAQCVCRLNSTETS